uniref:Uncharacterized protein n=1 Tax=Zea mays TaxID=4577 RepID=A0A804MNI7_MAIZE
MAPQISRLDHLPTPQNFDYKTALLPWSSKKKGTKERDLDPHTSRLSSSRPKDNENIKQENQRKQSKSIALEAKRAPRRRRPATSHVRRTRTHRCIYGAPEPAVGRHGGRAAPGLRPRQAPQRRRPGERAGRRSCAGKPGWAAAAVTTPPARRGAPPCTTGW